MALATRRRLGDLDGEAATLNNLVHLHSRTGRPDTGLEHALEALKLARQGPNTDREASALNATASCLNQLGRHAEALEHMLQVLTIRTARGDGHRLGLAYTITGSTYLALRQLKQAEACYLRAHDIAHANGDTFGQAEATLGRARVLRARGQDAAARGCAEQAVLVFEALKAHGDTVDEARAMLAALQSDR